MLVIYKYITSQSVANLTVMELNENGQNFAVIGCPIEHSLSPVLHNEVFKQTGIVAQYSKLNIEEENLAEFVETFRIGKIKGINVTLPHKEHIIPLLDDINPWANSIGAVNCVLKTNSTLIGYNTDWYGFSMLLKSNGIQADDKSCLIVGAGGVSKSVVYSLIQSGVKSITITNRTLNNACKLVDHFKIISHQTELTSIPLDISKIEKLKPDIIINCTSVGMSPDFSDTPLPDYPFHSRQILVDTIYNPLKTQLMKDAENGGAKVINGMDMFIYQGLASLDLWLKMDISKQVKYTELKDHLTEILSI